MLHIYYLINIQSVILFQVKIILNYINIYNLLIYQMSIDGYLIRFNGWNWFVQIIN